MTLEQAPQEGEGWKVSLSISPPFFSFSIRCAVQEQGPSPIQLSVVAGFPARRGRPPSNSRASVL